MLPTFPLTTERMTRIAALVNSRTATVVRHVSGAVLVIGESGRRVFASEAALLEAAGA